MFALNKNINPIYKTSTSLTNLSSMSFIFSVCNIKNYPSCKQPLRYLCNTSLPFNNPKKSIQLPTPLPSSKNDIMTENPNNLKKNIRARAWCFTLNNYTPADLLFFNSSDSFTYQYLCYGLVVGALNTPHLQGFFYYKFKLSLLNLI
jgi:hypothetical protein